MRTHRFIPDAWDRRILNRQMEVFSKLVARVDYTTQINSARAMLRVLEAAARRFILVLALMAPALKPQAPREMTPPAAKRLGGAPDPRWPSQRFRLIETIPMLGAVLRMETPHKGPQVTRLPLASLGLAQHGQSQPDTEPPPDEIEPWDRVMARLNALKDVAARPEHHATRLRRWFARQAGRDEARRFARRSPLRFGRPAALLQGDHLHPTKGPRDPLQELLWTSDQLALKAQAP